MNLEGAVDPNESRVFIDAITNRDLSAVRRVPKADLHIHSTLSASVTSTARALGVSIPPAVSRYEGLEPFFRYYDIHVKPHLRTSEAIRAVIEAGIDDAIADGVTRIEMSFDLKHLPVFNATADAYFGFIDGLVERCTGRIELCPEIGIPRPFDPADRFLEPTFHAYLESGLFRSVDVYGAEIAELLPHLVPFYRDAARRGMICKAHVGEFGPAESVLEAVDLLDLDEIQHGVRAADSVPVMSELASRGIRLNLCPTSNVVLGAVPNLQSHPIRRLLDAGINVTINTDDPLVFHRTVSEEYLAVFEADLVSAEELDAIRRTGLRLHTR